MIEAFEEAFRELERAMDDVATATIRANNVEFPPVEITTAASPEPDPGRTGDDLADLRRWAVDPVARDAELWRRGDEAVDAELEAMGATVSQTRLDEIVVDVRVYLAEQLRQFGDPGQ